MSFSKFNHELLISNKNRVRQSKNQNKVRLDKGQMSNSNGKWVMMLNQGAV